MTLNIQVWCKHYNGTAFHTTCKAGVAYHAVRDKNRYPCFQNDDVAARCSRCTYPTPEEIAQEEQEIQRVAVQFLTRLADGGVCTVCGEPIERKEKIGRCVVGWPCGHRMYQGGLGE